MPWRAPPEELTWAVEVFSTVFLHVLFCFHIHTICYENCKIIKRSDMKLIETCPWVTVFSPLSPLSLLWKLPSLLLRWLPQDLQDPQGLFDAWHPMQGAWPWVLAPPLHRKDLRLAVARQANPKQRWPGKTRCCTSHKSPILSARDVPWISPRIARCRRHKRGALEDLQGFSGEPRHEALNVTGAWDKLTLTLLDYDDKVCSVLSVIIQGFLELWCWGLENESN